MSNQQTAFAGFTEENHATSDLLCEIKVVSTRQHFVAEAGGALEKADAIAKVARSFYESASWYDPEKEAVVVIVLDRRSRIKGFNLVSLGTVSASLIAAREVFRPAIALAGSSIILTHSHPTGDPSPSTADIQVTRVIKDAGQVLGIDLYDHIILGDAARNPLGTPFYSFRESGLIS